MRDRYLIQRQACVLVCAFMNSFPFLLSDKVLYDIVMRNSKEWSIRPKFCDNTSIPYAGKYYRILVWSERLLRHVSKDEVFSHSNAGCVLLPFYASMRPTRRYCRFTMVFRMVVRSIDLTPVTRHFYLARLKRPIPRSVHDILTLSSTYNLVISTDYLRNLYA